MRSRERLLVALALAFYPFAQLAIRLAVSQSLEWDETEQVVLSQAFALGYALDAAQPPLYTWLQRLFFGVFGINTFAVASLRALLETATVTLLFRSGRLLRLDRVPALLAALSLWVVPQFSVEALRMTHSVLATCLAAAVLHAVVRLREWGRTIDYAALGLLLGLGALAKYNVALAGAALLAAGCSLPSFRARLLDRRLLLTLAIAAALVAPHLAWLLGHAGTATAHLGDKLKLAHGTRWSPATTARGMARLAGSIAVFLPPIALYLIVFGRPRPGGRSPAGPETSEVARLIERFWLAALGAMALAVIVLGLPSFRDHWLQPVLFALPLYLFLRWPPAPGRGARTVAFAWVVAVVVAFTLGWRFVEVWAGHRFDADPRLNDPVPEVAAQLREAGFRQGLIVADHHLIGGNLRREFPRAAVVMAAVGAVPGGVPRAPCLIVWDARKVIGVPEVIAPWVPAGNDVPRYAEAHARRAGRALYRVGFILADRCGP